MDARLRSLDLFDQLLALHDQERDPAASVSDEKQKKEIESTVSFSQPPQANLTESLGLLEDCFSSLYSSRRLEAGRKEVRKLDRPPKEELKEEEPVKEVSPSVSEEYRRMKRDLHKPSNRHMLRTTLMEEMQDVSSSDDEDDDSLMNPRSLSVAFKPPPPSSSFTKSRDQQLSQEYADRMAAEVRMAFYEEMEGWWEEHGSVLGQLKGKREEVARGWERKFVRGQLDTLLMSPDVDDDHKGFIQSSTGRVATIKREIEEELRRFVEGEEKSEQEGLPLLTAIKSSRNSAVPSPERVGIKPPSPADREEKEKLLKASFDQAARKAEKRAWSCFVCGFGNQATDLRCLVCGRTQGVRPGDKARKEEEEEKERVDSSRWWEEDEAEKFETMQRQTQKQAREVNDMAFEIEELLGMVRKTQTL